MTTNSPTSATELGSDALFDALNEITGKAKEIEALVVAGNVDLRPMFPKVEEHTPVWLGIEIRTNPYLPDDTGFILDVKGHPKARINFKSNVSVHQIRPTQHTFTTSITFPLPVNQLPTSAVGFGWHGLLALLVFSRIPAPPIPSKERKLK